ncbi:MAG TPA: hypothetical protein VFW66_02360 [Gemmatimonadales bacterium]|nr:hypothetical protein [Gemmatimonadales bacterium]
MPDAEFIRQAASGGPRAISSDAAIVRIEKAGSVTTLRPGTNGFTCTLMPDGTNAPFCGDKHAWPWMVAAMTRQPKPPNTEPGVSYMAQGGTHFETPNGEVVMEPGPNTRAVKEPPHWMLMWPVDPATSGLPTKPNPMGVYVMFAGTPYAHLMVYQNPGQLKPAPSTEE